MGLSGGLRLTIHLRHKNPPLLSQNMAVRTCSGKFNLGSRESLESMGLEILGPLART